MCIGDVNPQQGALVEQEICKAGGEGYYVDCDVRRLKDLERVRDDLAARWGGVDIVVNNAGVASAGSIEDTPMMNSYNVSKAGVIALSETMSQELRENGIHVSCVCPAFFQTNLTEGMRSVIPGIQGNVAKLMKRSTISAEDVADDIFRAVQSNTFWVLPHVKERRMWVLKRHAPWAFDWLMHQGSKSWIKKMSAKPNS